MKTQDTNLEELKELHRLIRKYHTLFWVSEPELLEPIEKLQLTIINELPATKQHNLVEKLVAEKN